MVYYVIRRLIWLIVVLLFITAITYTIFFLMSPVNPAILFAGKQPTLATINEVKQEFGLNKPVGVQYLIFVRHVFFGDRYGWRGLGFSFVTRTAVLSELGPRLVITTTLVIGSAIVWLALGIPIGVISAVQHRTVLDRLVMGFAVFFVSAPVFWLGLIFLWLFWF